MRDIGRTLVIFVWQEPCRWSFDQSAVMPPSTNRQLPVMYDASSDARNKDRGGDLLRRARSAHHCALGCIIIVVLYSVASSLDATRMKWRKYRAGANSIDADAVRRMIHSHAVVKPAIAAFAVSYWTVLLPAITARTEATLMMLQPGRWKCGMTALAQKA